MTKQEAIEWAGGVVLLSKLLNITHGAVSQWEEVPKDKQHDLIQLSGGKLELDAKYKLQAVTGINS